MKLDRNGYAPSIMQRDLSCCYLCGCSDQKLDRHEIFSGAYRKKSKAHGLWVMLCHDRCHLNGVHKDASEALRLKTKGQLVAMRKYQWTVKDFIREFGKNYLYVFD